MLRVVNYNMRAEYDAEDDVKLNEMMGNMQALIVRMNVKLQI